MLRILACALALTFLALPAAAQTEIDAWSGTLETPQGNLRLRIQLTPTDDGPRADFMSLDQGGARVPLDEFTAEDGKLTFELAVAGVSYEGTLDEAGEVATGTFKQGGGELPLVLTLGTVPGPEKPLQVWRGTLNVGQELPLVFNVFETSGDGRASIDSPVQKAIGIPATYSSEGGNVRFEVPSLGASYEGKLSDDGKTLDGEWSQGGGSAPLQLVLDE